MFERFSAWFSRPLTLGLAAGVAAAGLAVVIIPRITDKPREEVALSRPASVPGDPAAPPAAIAEQDKPSAAPAPPAPKRSAASRPATEPNVRQPEGPRAAQAPSGTLADVPAAAGERKTSEQEGQLSRPADTAQGVPAAPASQPAAPPPPAPSVAEPKPPPREQVVTALASKSSAPVVPFEYVLERQGSDGAWTGIEPAAPVGENDQIRVAVQTNTQGTLLVDLRIPGGSSRSLFRGAVQPGTRFHIPAQGGLPAGRGEHRLVMSHLPAVAGQQQTMAFRQGAASAENRARKEASSRDTAVGGAAASPAPSPYTVEIPIRFR